MTNTSMDFLTGDRATFSFSDNALIWNCSEWFDGCDNKEIQYRLFNLCNDIDAATVTDLGYQLIAKLIDAAHYISPELFNSFFDHNDAFLDSGLHVTHGNLMTLAKT